MGHIFISYKSQQRELALQVRDKLQEWGHETWLDVDKLEAGTYWANDIDAALKSCQTCIGIMTPLSISSRYVTNEWDMAIMKRKLFIPLMFEATEPHYKYIDIQYIDFTADAKEASFSQLRERLSSFDPASTKAPDDPYAEYLQQLYERINKYLSAKLITSLRNTEGEPEPISVSVQRFDDAVESPYHKPQQVDPLFASGGVGEAEAFNVDALYKAVDYYDGRVLLLGEPGSGKTIALLQLARDAVVKRQQDSTAPLPILAIIPTWDVKEKPSLTEWLANSFGSPADVATIVAAGQALLLLDGLDELVAPFATFESSSDPREDFLNLLPTNNQIVMTSRTKDYLRLNVKANLNGAIEMRPLSREQTEAYLRDQPELRQLLDNNAEMAEWLRSTLLLSLFAFAYQSLSEEDRARLLAIESYGELRSELVRYYLHERYLHESRKPHQELKYALAEIENTLGYHAAGVQLTPNGLALTPRNREADLEVIALAQELDYVLSFDPDYVNYAIIFVHKFIGAHLAYNFLVPKLGYPLDDFWRTDAEFLLSDVDDPRVGDTLYQALLKATYLQPKRNVVYPLLHREDQRVFDYLRQGGDADRVRIIEELYNDYVASPDAYSISDALKAAITSVYKEVVG